MKSNLYKLWKIFSKKQKQKYVGLFLLQFVGSVLELLGVSMLVPFMQAVISPETLMKTDIVIELMARLKITTQRELIILFILGLISIYAIKNIALALILYVQYKVIWDDKQEMETRLLNYYAHQDYNYHVMHNSAEMQRTILSDAGNVFTQVQEIFAIIAEIMTSSILIVYLLFTSKLITIGILGLLGGFLILYFKVFKNRLIRYSQISQECGAEGILWMHQLFDGIKEIKVRNAEEYFVKKFRRVRQLQYSMMKRAAFSQQSPKYLLEMLCTCGILSLLLWKIILGANLGAMVTQLAVFAVAAYRLLPSANRLSSGIAAIYNGFASVNVVYDALKDREDDYELHQMNPLSSETRADELEKQDIELKNVSYKYPGTERMILNYANLKLTPGESVGLRGPSGAGKTTTADLLLGILNPTHGSITYGGVDISELGSDWKKKVGYIPQSISLSDDTIRNNIVYGLDNITDEMVWEALREAQLYDFVKSKKEGLDLIIGENGVRLSGGQRQRIGIARALCFDPEILILDEATSALDTETEQAVMDAIDVLKGKKTLLIIAHRLSTLEKCDHIYLVDNGEIVLQG